MCQSCSNEYEGGCLPPKSNDNCKAYVSKETTEIETCETCEFSEEYESVNFLMCSESEKPKRVKRKQSACTNYIPVQDVVDDEPEGDLEDQLDELLNDGGQEEQIYIYRGLV
jgi:hypothetical protein